MFSQAFVQLDEIQSEVFLEIFLENGVVQEEFDGSTLWLGYGPEAHGAITFFDMNFFHTQSRNYTPAYIIKTTRLELIEKLRTLDFDKVLSLKVLNNYDLQYKEDVEKIKSWINDGTIEKMVAITTESYTHSEKFSPITMIYKCLSSMPGFLYGFWNNDGGIIGMTPEPLFVCNQHKCYTFALAGTISTNEPEFKSILQNDPKEISEHQLVIDDIENKLNGMNSLDTNSGGMNSNDNKKVVKAISDIKIESTELLHFGSIAHLKTRINFSFNSDKTEELVGALSPTAALGGYPAKASSLRLKNTHHYRFMGEKRFFGGTVGLKYRGYAQGLVAIRNIQWDSLKIWIESGSGIVLESDVDKELQEVQNKREVVKKVFQN